MLVNSWDKIRLYKVTVSKHFHHDFHEIRGNVEILGAYIDLSYIVLSPEIPDFC